MEDLLKNIIVCDGCKKSWSKNKKMFETAWSGVHWCGDKRCASIIMNRECDRIRRHKLFFVYYISKRHRFRKFIGTGRTIKKADKIITDYCRKMEIDNHQTIYRTKLKERKNENRKRDKRSRAKADKR